MISPVQQSSPNFGYGASVATVPPPDSEAADQVQPARSTDRGAPESDADAGAKKAQASPKQPAEETSLSNEDLTAAAREMVEKIKKQSRPSQRNLEFEVDEENNRVVISVINSDTREIIRTIPNDDFVVRSGAEFLESGHFFSSAA